MPLCTTGEPQICVFPEAPALLPVVEAMSTRLAHLPSDIVTVPHRLDQAGLDPSGTDAGFGVDSDPWFVADALSGIVAAHSTLACEPSDASTESEKTIANTEYFTILEWLASRIYGGPRPHDVHTTLDDVIDVDDIRDVLAKSESEQQAWAQEHLDRMRAACVGAVDGR